MIGISCTQFSRDPFSRWIGPISEKFLLWELFSEAEMNVAVDTDAIRDLLSSYDLSYSLHTPICDMNVAALTERLRESSIEVLRDNARAANILGIEMLTVHPGLSSMVVKGTEQKALERAKVSMRELEKISSEYGVTMAIENMPNVPFFLGRTASQLAEIIDGTDLKVCYDIGHANTMGENDSMVELLGDRIVNIHIHDNHGERDEHNTIGDGTVDFERVIESLRGYTRNYVIESRSFESAVESQERLKRLLS